MESPFIPLASFPSHITSQRLNAGVRHPGSHKCRCSSVEELLICNQRVTGSNPVAGSDKGVIACLESESPRSGSFGLGLR